MPADPPRPQQLHEGNPEPMPGESAFDALLRESRDGWLEQPQEKPGLLARVVLLLRRTRRFVSAVLFLLGRGIGRWIGHNAGPLARTAETLGWPALMLGLCWMANPSNPFFIGEAFPWPWLGPWLIALRYGVGWGLGATAGLLVAWALLAPVASAALFPRLYFLGGAIMALVAGEFGSYWRTRILKLEESVRYLGDKAERLTRRLYLMKLSHDELEYELVDRPRTLREALVDLRVMLDDLTARRTGDMSGLPGARQVLDFVVNHCRVESAAIYLINAQGELEPVAMVGRMSRPDPDDPMIERALESGHQVHLQDALLERVQRSALIAATPLMDENGKALGIMLIGNMPFTALTAENLQTVAVLIESYADYLRATHSAGELVRLWPAAPRELASEFAWLTRMREDHGLESYCVIWRARYHDPDDLLDTIVALHSRGESAWRWPFSGTADAKTACVIALVPFTDSAGLRIYRQRLIDTVCDSRDDVFPRQLSATDLRLGGEGKFERLRDMVEGKPA